MKLEVGKYYRTREGRKVGPLQISESGDEGGFWIDCYGLIRQDGRYGYGERSFQSTLDLIAEWTDEPTEIGPTLSGDTIDKIAIDSLKWHYATEMPPLEKEAFREAFRIVLRYYGVTV